MKLRVLLVICLTIVWACPVMSKQELRVNMIIDEVDSVLIDAPLSLCWVPDSIYVLNSGSYNILRLSTDWQLEGVFGQAGEARGEFYNPQSMTLYHDTLYLDTMAKVILFDLDGNEVRRYGRAPVNGLFVGHGDLLLSSTNSGGHIAAVLDDTLGVSLRFGPEPIFPPHNWRIMQAPDNGYVLLDESDGYAYQVDSHYKATGRHDLGLGRWWCELKEGARRGWGKDVLIYGIYDPDRGYWIIHYPEIGGLPRLYLYSADWQSKRYLELDFHIDQVYITPQEQLCLVSEHESRIYLCEIPWH